MFDKYQEKGAYHWDWYRNQEWYRKCVDRCADFCKGSTLDVGCGDGVVSYKIAVKGFDVLGIDDNPTAIEFATAYNPYGKFKAQDLNEKIKGKWEYMVCLNVIEHLERPERIKEIFNNNITKAAIIITDVPQEKPSKYHVKEFTPYELKQMFHTRKVIPFKIDDNFHGIEVYK